MRRDKSVTHVATIQELTVFCGLQFLQLNWSRINWTQIFNHYYFYYLLLIFINSATDQHHNHQILIKRARGVQFAQAHNNFSLSSYHYASNDLSSHVIIQCIGDWFMSVCIAFMYILYTAAAVNNYQAILSPPALVNVVWLVTLQQQCINVHHCKLLTKEIQMHSRGR